MASRTSSVPRKSSRPTADPDGRPAPKYPLPGEPGLSQDFPRFVCVFGPDPSLARSSGARGGWSMTRR